MPLKDRQRQARRPAQGARRGHQSRGALRERAARGVRRWLGQRRRGTPAAQDHSDRRARLQHHHPQRLARHSVHAVDQSVCGMRAWMHLLRRWRYADPDGRRQDTTPCRYPRRRRDLRHCSRRLVPPLRQDTRARALERNQAGVSGNARRRNVAGRRRRSSIPDRARLEVRHRHHVGRRSAPVPHDQQQAHGHRRFCSARSQRIATIAWDISAE